MFRSHLDRSSIMHGNLLVSNKRERRYRNSAVFGNNEAKVVDPASILSLAVDSHDAIAIWDVSEHFLVSPVFIIDFN